MKHKANGVVRYDHHDNEKADPDAISPKMLARKPKKVPNSKEEPIQDAKMEGSRTPQD